MDFIGRLGGLRFENCEGYFKEKGRPYKIPWDYSSTFNIWGTRFWVLLCRWQGLTVQGQELRSLRAVPCL